jgi:hypothetical protein
VLAYQPLELGPATDQRQSTQIDTVEMEDVEGVEDQRVRSPSQSLLQSVEVGSATLVLHDHLAVEDRRAAFEAVGGGNYARIPVRPVMTVARKGAHTTVVPQEQRAVAIMLDLVNPALSLGRLIRKGG